MGPKIGSWARIHVLSLQFSVFRRAPGAVERAERLRLVLGQPLVAHLAMVKRVLDDMKRMLDLGAHARFGALVAFLQPTEFVIL